MYKIVTIDDYNLVYKYTYPHARVSPDGTEVVLSCIYGDGNMTREQAKEYISSNWGSTTNG